MLRFLRSTRSRAFSLLELIVAIVILAILAAVAIPTFAGVIERTYDEKAQLEMKSMQRQAWAMAALDQTMVYDYEYFPTTPTGSGALVDGTYAGALELVMIPAGERSTKHGDVSVAIDPDDPKGLVLAMLSESGSCILLWANSQAVKRTEVHPELADNCIANAGLNPETPGTGYILSSPLALTAADTTITAFWPVKAGVTKYRLYRDGSTIPVYEADVKDIKTCQVGTVTRLCFPDENLARGTAYTYTLSAGNLVGWSKPSPPVSARTAPAAPTNVTAVVSGETVQVTWTAPSAANGYYLYRSQDGVEATLLTPVVGGTTTTYTDSTVARGSAYTYSLRAYNEAGTSPSSEPATATLRVLAVNLSGTVAGTTAQLSWTRPAGATGYEVYRDRTRIATIESGDTLNYTDSGLPTGKTSAYHVVATAPAGPSVDSNTVNLTTVPGAVTLNAAVSGSSIGLTWNQAAAAQGYRIYRSLNGGAYQTLTTVTPGSATAYQDSAVVPGNKYTYQVEPYNGAGSAQRSNTASATVPVAAPTLSGSPSGTTINLSWNQPAGATGYQVYRGTTLISTITSGTTTAYADTGRATGTTYTYYVIATAPAASSGASNTVSVTTAVAAPTVNAATTGDISSLSVTWNKPTGTSSFDLYRSTSSNMAGATRVLDNTTVTSYTNTGLASGTLYYYRVVAANSTGLTTDSNVDNAPTRPRNTGEPWVRAIHDHSAALDISWGASDSGAVYHVDRIREGGNWERVVSYGGGTGFRNRVWQPWELGHLYTYRVIAEKHGVTSPNWIGTGWVRPTSYTLSAWRNATYGETNWPYYDGSGSTVMWFGEGFSVGEAQANMKRYVRSATDTDGTGTLASNKNYCYRVEAWSGGNGDGAHLATTNTICY